MHFLFPEFLWLLPLAALLWFVPRRNRQWSHAIVRTVVVVALLLGLARPLLVRNAWMDHHVVIVDRSASIADADAVQSALANVRLQLPADSVHVLLEVGAEDRDVAGQDQPVAGFERRLTLSAGLASPLGTAISMALRAIPVGAGGAITLISDGLASDDRWQLAMQELTERGLPLHVVEVAGSQPDVRLVGLRALDELRVGQVGRIRIAVAAQQAQIQVTLHVDGEQVAQSRELPCTGVSNIDLPFEPQLGGYRALTAKVVRLDAPDANADNNQLQRVVAVQDPLQVLYLGARVEDAAERLRQLVGNGFAVREPLLNGPLDLQHIDLTVLDDRPAELVPESWQQQLQAAVEQRGMGLLVSGGRSAFGPGGYHNTVIERISPVEYVQKEEKKDPSTTLAIVIDTSGSMVGNRMTLAKEVARLAIRRLQPHDKVGIVEFYGTKQWAAPIQSAANSIDLQRALNRLGAAGGTVLFPAVEESYYALKNVQTRYKHVLIVTDAGVETGPYEALLRKMADDGIAVSTVLVGPGRHSEFLVELADWGGGRYYHSPDRFNLPELLLKKPSTSMLPAYRPGVFPVSARGGRGWWGDVDVTAMPAVQTLVETSLRPGADLLLSVAGSNRPVMASWQYGLGRVTAFCTEPVGPGTRGFREWPGYGAMLGRILSRTARSAQAPFSVSLRRDATDVHITARRQVRNVVLPSIREVAQEGTATSGIELALREVAPGVFEGQTVASRGATVCLQVATEDGWLHRACSAALEAQVPETQVDPRAALPMAKIATATNGMHVVAEGVIPKLLVARRGTPLQVWPLWPWFVAFALLCYLLDVWHRRRASHARRLV